MIKIKKIIIGFLIFGVSVFIIASSITSILGIDTNNTPIAVVLIYLSVFPCLVSGFLYAYQIKDIKPKKSLALIVFLLFILFCIFGASIYSFFL